MKTLSKAEARDMRLLAKFTEVFCRKHHHVARKPFSMKQIDFSSIDSKSLLLCPDCSHLLSYGLLMRHKCPHDPKPMCQKCSDQCYTGNYKRKIREVMKFSGRYLILRGRLDLLYHYFR